MPRSGIAVAPSPCVSHSFAYVETTYAGFERILVAHGPALTEPARAHPDRARRLLGILVETLAGVAVGFAVGRVVSAVGRELGAEERDAIGRQLDANLWLPTAPRSALPHHLTEDGPQLLAADLVAILQPRLCREVAGSQTLVAAIRDIVVRRAPDRAAAFDAMLDRLAADEIAAFGFGEHLHVGWHAFCAALTGASLADATIGSARVHATWRTWRDHAAPQRESRDEEFILRVG